jgi:hypothetical protein
LNLKLNFENRYQFVKKKYLKLKISKTKVIEKNEIKNFLNLNSIQMKTKENPLEIIQIRYKNQ